MTFSVFLLAVLGLSLGAGMAQGGDRHDAPGRGGSAEYRYEQGRRGNDYRRDDGRGVILYQPRYQPQGYERGYERRHNPRYDPRYNARHEYRDNRRHDARNHRDQHDGYRDQGYRGAPYYGAPYYRVPQQRHYRPHERNRQERGSGLRFYVR